MDPYYAYFNAPRVRGVSGDVPQPGDPGTQGRARQLAATARDLAARLRAVADAMYSASFRQAADPVGLVRGNSAQLASLMTSLESLVRAEGEELKLVRANLDRVDEGRKQAVAVIEHAKDEAWKAQAEARRRIAAGDRAGAAQAAESAASWLKQAEEAKTALDLLLETAKTYLAEWSTTHDEISACVKAGRDGVRAARVQLDRFETYAQGVALQGFQEIIREQSELLGHLTDTQERVLDVAENNDSVGNWSEIKGEVRKAIPIMKGAGLLALGLLFAPMASNALRSVRRRG